MLATQTIQIMLRPYLDRPRSHNALPSLQFFLTRSLP
jgi:hypothetical protein